MHLLRSRSRLGGALVMTIMIMVAIIAMIALSSDRMFSARKTTQLDLDRQRAALAAESVAAMIEAKLDETAADLKRLGKNLEDDPTKWWNLVGCSYMNGTTPVMAQTGLWINGCMVRWRIEPVKVYDTTLGSATPSGQFTVNSEPDASLADARRLAAGSGLFSQDAGFYHYRIVTEACALANPNGGGDHGIGEAGDIINPWSDPTLRTTSVQSQRIVQLSIVNLFKYVIFYAANGPTGDIEFHPGPPLNIPKGSIHSNGAIYFGGQGRAYAGGDYHNSASNGSNIVIGPTDPNASAKSAITAVNGVFRMRKASNTWYAGHVTDGSYALNPMTIPLAGGSITNGATTFNMPSGADPLNLNGDDDPSLLVMLNGSYLLSDNDARKQYDNGTGGKVDLQVRGGANSGRVVVPVNTLANIKELAGYPFEPQRLAGDGLPLYPKAPGNIGAGVTLYPTASHELVYLNGTTPTLTPTATIAVANDLPLFQFTDAGGKPYNDVWPDQSATPALPPTLDNAVGKSATYLPVLAANGYYLDASLNGAGVSTETGLTIRERGAANALFTWSTDVDAAAGTMPTGTLASTATAPWNGFPACLTSATTYLAPGTLPASPSETLRAHVAMMEANFAVYLGKDASGKPIDITEAFFQYQMETAAAAGNINQLIAHEDEFINRRETDWLVLNGYLTAAGAASYRINGLTLNLQQVQAFLRSYMMPDGTLAMTHFSGLIYAHRTPRAAGTFDPLRPRGFHPWTGVTTIPGSELFAAPATWKFGYPVAGTVAGGPDTTATTRLGGWTVYPSNLAVRLSNGATVDWGGRQADAGNRNRGLTLVTPNQCYVIGDFNTIADSVGKVPPCAVFADGLTVLSNNWTDAGTPTPTSPQPLGADTGYNFSVVINNVPTDIENDSDEGSGGVHNAVRFLENWSGKDYSFYGSLVVMNRMRYSRSYLGAGNYYSPPIRLFNYNDDLLTKDGQPPLSPWGVQVTRVVSTINLFNN